MKLEEMVSIVSLETNIPKDVVMLAYKSFWEFIKNTIEELPLKEDLTEEEFKELRTNFNLPSLGKLHVSYDYYKGVKKRFEYIKNLNKNVCNKEDQTST